MMRKPIAGRDSRAWAGSAKEDSRSMGSNMADSRPQDVYKLHELRHKIEDTQYVDGAVNRIANFLTSALDKKGKDEQ